MLSALIFFNFPFRVLLGCSFGSFNVFPTFSVFFNFAFRAAVSHFFVSLAYFFRIFFVVFWAFCAFFRFLRDFIILSWVPPSPGGSSLTSTNHVHKLFSSQCFSPLNNQIIFSHTIFN